MSTIHLRNLRLSGRKPNHMANFCHRGVMVLVNRWNTSEKPGARLGKASAFAQGSTSSGTRFTGDSVKATTHRMKIVHERDLTCVVKCTATDTTTPLPSTTQVHRVHFHTEDLQIALASYNACRHHHYIRFLVEKGPHIDTCSALPLPIVASEDGRCSVCTKGELEAGRGALCQHVPRRAKAAAVCIKDATTTDEPPPPLP